MQLTETQNAIRDMYRSYMTNELEPRTEAFESGEESVFPFMKKMIKDLGLDVAVDQMFNSDDSSSAKDESEKPTGGEDMKALADFAQAQLIIEVSRINPGFQQSFGVSVGLCGGNIAMRGTAFQKEKYARPLMKGEKVGCWCLTEPGAGSDAFGSMKSKVRREGDHYVMNGSKTFITNGPDGDIFLVYARNEEDNSIQAFILEREFEGLSTGKPFKKMGMRCSPTSEVFFDNVRIPLENILGGGNSDRDHVRKSLSRERMGISIMGYAIAERCFEIARDYAKEREQGGQPIANYQLIQNRLARMYIDVANARRIVYGTVDSSQELSALDASAAKLYLAEVGTRVATEAIHILAGYGYMEEYKVERLMRDAMLLELGGGTTEIQILTIARHILAT
ncbi:MAG: acyl-CoA dehydrogenase family protein [Proteobacteria bacterium]|nr:acyl-CoA dehydrogenase family protein [Pseudomonadota bacterium]